MGYWRLGVGNSEVNLDGYDLVQNGLRWRWHSSGLHS